MGQTSYLIENVELGGRRKSWRFVLIIAEFTIRFIDLRKYNK